MHSPTEQKLKITPPTSFTGKPPTPDSLPKDRRPIKRSPEARAILQHFKDIQRGVDKERNPWQIFPLNPEDYEELLRLIEEDEQLEGYVEDKLRYDYSPRERRLIVRMPTKLHEIFMGVVDKSIEAQLDEFRNGTGAVACFAHMIQNEWSADIHFPTDDGGNTKRHKRSPDGEYRHLDADFPGIVLEVSYSQKRKDLPVLADDYIMGSKGDTRVVVGLDLEYGKLSSSEEGRKATLSMWRAEIFGAGHNARLVATKVVDNEPFRDDQGNPTGRGLHINLSDFAYPALSQQYLGGKDRNIVVSADRLCSSLKRAELSHGGPRQPRVGSPFRGILCPRLATPPEELRPDDEDKWTKKEKRDEERAEKEDEDFPPQKKQRR